MKQLLLLSFVLNFSSFAAESANKCNENFSKDWISNPDLYAPSGRVKYSKAKEFISMWEKENIEILSSLNDVEQRYIGHYIRTAHVPLNHYLRTGETLYPGFTLDVLKDGVSVIEEAISKSVTKEDVVLYRGMNFNSEENFLSIGMVESSHFSSEIFLSTSINKYSAEKFSQRGVTLSSDVYEKMPFHVLLEIEVPKGTPALLVGGSQMTKSSIFSSFEVEVLLNRGEKLFIKKIEISDNRAYVKARILSR